MIRFLGHIDVAEEELGNKRRLLFGCDDENDIPSLPNGAGFTLPSGATTGIPAPWSIALVAGGSSYVLNGDYDWVEL